MGFSFCYNSFMETLIHADIFFFVSTISLVVITIGLAWALVYLIRILRNVRDISDKARVESDEIVSDLRSFRRAIKEEGLKWKSISALIRSFFTLRAVRGKKHRKTSSSE